MLKALPARHGPPTLKFVSHAVLKASRMMEMTSTRRQNRTGTATLPTMNGRAARSRPRPGGSARPTQKRAALCAANHTNTMLSVCW